MSERLTPEREADIRRAAIIVNNPHGEWSPRGEWAAETIACLLAELDAVRAERDEYKVWADERHSAALYAEEQNELYHDALDRAERAEATLAAIRAWIADTERAEAEAENNGYASAQDDVLALLDTPLKETL